MNYNSKITLEEIKRKLPISDLLYHYDGVCTNKSSGSWWCIKHESKGKDGGHKTPSLVAKDERGTATCMSQKCFEADNIFGIISKMENLDIKNDFNKIKQIACDIANIGNKTISHTKKTDSKKAHPINSLGKKHLSYLKSIGISEETAEQFGLKSRYDYILYPQLEKGVVKGYKGISIVKDKENKKSKKFFEDHTSAIWGKLEKQTNKHIIFTEGEKDCLRLHEEILKQNKENDFLILTLTTGAGSIPKTLINEITDLEPSNISIIYDNDEAGKKGSKKLSEELVKYINEVTILSFSENNTVGYDLTDFLEEGGQFDDLWNLDKKIITSKNISLDNSSFFCDKNISFKLGDLQNNPPPIKWLIKDFITENKVGSIVAKGSTGKSWFLLQLAVSIASGEDFMGMHNPSNNGGNVLYIMGEEDKDDIHRRVSSIKDSYTKQNGFKGKEIADKNLSFLCVNGRNVTLIKESELLNDLKIYTKLQKPKLIILDPAIRFFEGDENNSNDATKFVEILEELKNMGTTVLFAHHTGKMMSDTLDQHSARGSSAFIDAARWNLVLKKINKKDANRYCFENDPTSELKTEECDFYINAEIVKCNGFKPISNEFTFKRLPNGVLVRNPKLVIKNT